MVSNSWEHLLDELQLLNACLLRDVRLRTQKNQQLDLLQGLVLNESEIIEILGNPAAIPPTLDDDLHERIHTRNGKHHANTSLTQLSSLFQLERIEELCLLLCLAPEIDNRYARVFAFLQDDVTRRQPGVELALRLFCNDTQELLDNRGVFSSNGTLFRNKLLLWSQPSDKQLPLPQRTLKVDDRIAAFLFQTPELDDCLVNWVEILSPTKEANNCSAPQELIEKTLRLVEDSFSGRGPFLRPLVHLYGRPGSGRRSLAVLASHHVGLPLIVADVRKLPNGETSEVDLLWRLCREALLLPAVILIEHFDDLLAEGRQRDLAAIVEAANYFSPITFLSGTKIWRPENLRHFYLSLECPVPDATARIQFWRQHLNQISEGFGDNEIVELSSKFTFTEGQIQQTVQTAEHRAFWELQTNSPLTPAKVNEAARSIATPSLSGLARKVETNYSWPDI